MPTPIIIRRMVNAQRQIQGADVDLRPLTNTEFYRASRIVRETAEKLDVLRDRLMTESRRRTSI